MVPDDLSVGLRLPSEEHDAYARITCVFDWTLARNSDGLTLAYAFVAAGETARKGRAA